MKVADTVFTLGIDIGSVSFAYVLLDSENKLIHSDYCPHYGNILSCLQDQLRGLDWSSKQTDPLSLRFDQIRF